MTFLRLQFEGERVAWQNRKMARRLRDAEHNAAVANEGWDRAVAEREEAGGHIVRLLEENVTLQHELDETTLRLRSFAARLEQMTGEKVVEAVSTDG